MGVWGPGLFSDDTACDIRDHYRELLEDGADLETWERDNPTLLPKRRAVLAKVRGQLIGPEPLRKRLRPPKRTGCGLAAGDVLAFALPHRIALLRVVRVGPHRRGGSPILEELDFAGSTRFHAFVMQRIDWRRAGFEKMHTISARAGDDAAPLPSFGISWAQLAERLRSRSAQ